MSSGSKIRLAAAEIQEWADERGQDLPREAMDIAVHETVGAVIDLVMGAIVTMDTDGVQTLDDQPWLAGLEQACGGSVRVAWAMRPEMYFQMAE